MNTSAPKLSLLTAMLLCSTYGFADDENLQKRVENLEAELAKLKSKPVLTKVDGGLRAQSTDGSSKFRFAGRLQADYAFYDKDKKDLGSGSELRTLRMGSRGTLAKNWDYKMEADFTTGGTVRITEGYVAYTGMQNAVVQVGNIFEMYGLEEYSSSVDTTFMERSVAVDAFVPDYNQGIAYMRWGDAYSFSTGLYGDSTNDAQKSTNESAGTSARLVFAPLHALGDVLSLGMSAYWRDVTSDTWRVRARPNSHVTPTRLVDTGAISDVDTATAVALEGSMTKGAFSVQAEYNQQMLNRNHGKKDAEFKGWYIYGSYVLTGETRPWDMPSATYGRPNSKNAGGAWEVALRFDQLDLDDTGAGIKGGEMKTATLGLNWYPVNNVRFATNLIQVQSEKSGIEDNPNILQMRAQVSF
jgi:phosphate-selective porin OprO/OprP